MNFGKIFCVASCLALVAGASGRAHGQDAQDQQKAAQANAPSSNAGCGTKFAPVNQSPSATSDSAATGANGAAASKRLTFDVESVKPTKRDPQAPGGIKALPSAREYVAQQAPVRLMIALMYKIPARQIACGPDWIDNDVWDVDAKTEDPHSLDELHEMYKNMLADEYKLKFHMASKEGNIFALTVDKSGLKMTPNDSAETWEIPVTAAGRAMFNGKRVNMEYLTWFLGNVLQNDERPVVDLTGLKGYYDFKLSFMPELPVGVNRENIPQEVLDRPSIFDALKQQLGLKLESQKGAVPYMVIDHIEKPAGN